MKKTVPASAGGERGESEKTNSNSESTEMESKLKEEASSPSSSCFSEELQGFTSASEIYSVRLLQAVADINSRLGGYYSIPGYLEIPTV